MRIKRPDRTLHNRLSDPFLRLLSICLLVISFAGAAYFAYTATSRRLTDVEGVGLQALAWITGIVASLAFGRMSAGAAARELITATCKVSFSTNSVALQ